MSDSLLSVEPSFNTEVLPDEPKKRNKGKDYKFHSEHPDEETAVSLITSSAGFEGHCWRLLKTSSNRRGATYWYRCVESLKCPMVQMKVDTIEELVIILWALTITTTHPISTSNKYGIDDQIKPNIDDYERIGVKPAAMLIGLTEKTENLPTVVQLNNYLKRLRNNREGNRGSRITLNDLLDFYKENKNVPEDFDKM